MELKEFIEDYLPDYQERLDELKRQYAWWDREVTNGVLLQWYSDNFKEAFKNYTKSQVTITGSDRITLDVEAIERSFPSPFCTTSKSMKTNSKQINYETIIS